MPRRLVSKRIADLKCKPGWKKLIDTTVVDEIMDSLSAEGQRQPIVVLRDGWVVSGLHRIAAATKLGWKYIEAVVEADPHNANLLEARQIVENLRRRQFTGPDRDALIARLVGLRSVVSGQTLPETRLTTQDRPIDAKQKTGRPPNLAVRDVAASEGRTVEAIKSSVKRARKAAAEPKDAPTATSVTRDKRGVEVPAHLLDYWQAKTGAFGKIASMIRGAQTELTKIEMDLPTILAGSVQFQALRQSLDDARQQSRSEIPTYVCSECEGDAARSAACDWCHRTGVMGPHVPAGVKSAVEFLR
jgi:hypothetical protein